MKENNMSPMDCQLPQQERDGKTIIGEGVRFERIRRITGYLVGERGTLQQRQAGRSGGPGKAHDFSVMSW